MTVKIYKYFTIEQRPLGPRRNTHDYDLMNRSLDLKIGTIKWHGAWRQFCFFPEGDTVWSLGCLNDVQEFVKGLRI